MHSTDISFTHIRLSLKIYDYPRSYRCRVKISIVSLVETAHDAIPPLLSPGRSNRYRQCIAQTKAPHLSPIPSPPTSPKRKRAQCSINMLLLCDLDFDEFPKNETFSDEFFEISLPQFQVFAGCEFMGKSCDQLFTPIILDKGVCYTFNMLNREEIFQNDVMFYDNFHNNGLKSNWTRDNGYSDNAQKDTYPRRALFAGADNALSLAFFHYGPDTDYVCASNEVQGYRISLHTPDTIPLLKKQYFQVPFDQDVLAAVTPKMMKTSSGVKNFPVEDRDCYLSNEKPLEYFQIYTPENCKLECLTNYTLKRCKCVNFYMPRKNSTPICGNGKFRCMREAEMKLKSLQLKTFEQSNEDNQDYCDCKPLCTELSYDVELSQTEIKFQETLRAYRVKVNKQIAENMRWSTLTIFFKLEQFLTFQRNELYGPTDFLANFGGLLGLFTGFSLLSLMELIYFFTLRIFCNTRRYRVWSGPLEEAKPSDFQEGQRKVQ
ncbi:hypothetical protein NQ317_019422 [Molorchus minor]|uniref:Uncharacterized protein n=1 Tax=Molorchus minor TaxID=1323400 RepID=A0ABQ9J0V9_9CUCU|nr:hypothetical protein NQ317_019422 [Molorchus minor]